MLKKLKLLYKYGKAVKRYVRNNGCIHHNRWLFSSVDNTEFNYNSGYLFDYVFKNYPEIEAYYVINDEEKRKKMNRLYNRACFINTLNEEGIEKALSCKNWFTSAGLPIYAKKLYRHYNIINLWHGIPLKKIALKDKNLGFFSRLMFKKIFSDNYRYILTSSEYLVPVMQDSFGVSRDKIKVWGQPRCDLLYKKNNAKKILAKIYKKELEFKHLVLYAPTYRDKEESRLFPFHDYDVDILEQYLAGSKTLILVKRHINEKADFSRYYTEHILPLDISFDIMEILNIFDTLITDYSSIYIDYLKLDRSIIFLPYDKESYIRNRGFNFDLDEVTPGIKPVDLQGFINALKGVDDEYYSIKRQETLKILDTTTGEVSETICRNILNV